MFDVERDVRQARSQGIFVLFVSWEGHNGRNERGLSFVSPPCHEIQGKQNVGLFQKVEVPKPSIQCLRLKQSCYSLPYLKPT